MQREKQIRSIIVRYGLPLLAFTFVTALSLILRRIFELGLTVAILNIGVMVWAAWMGGNGPGLMIDVLFEVLIDILAFTGHTPVRPIVLAIQFIARQGLFLPLILLVTARKEAERRLNEQRGFLQVTLASIGDAVLTTDKNGLVTYINPVAEQLTGLTKDQSVNRPVGEVFNIINEHSRLEVESPVAKVLREGQITGLANHTVLLRPDNTEVPIDDSGAPIKDANGNLLGVVLTFRDISDRRQVEKERTLAGELARMVDSGFDAIIVHDKGNRIITWNRGAEELYGWTREEAMGQEPQVLLKTVTPKPRSEIIADLERYGRWEGELTQTRKDGSEVAVLSRWVIDRDEQGQIRQVLETNMDISERRRVEVEREQLLTREQLARAEAEAANRSKDEFLATVSHELRAPLNAMLGWAKMLRTGSLDAESSSRALETIERNAKVQTQLIEDLLDISRIISGKLRLNVSALELSPIVEAAVESVKPAADAKGVRLQMVLDTQAGLISGDPGRLQQIVWNLLSNAVKFTPKGGRVQIRLARINSHVELVVSDTGKGISPDFLPYVFDRFRQADGGINRAYGGLGLGLSIVRNLTELHGGSVKVESQGENAGSTFTVQLPVMVAHQSGRLKAVDISSKFGSRLDCPDVLEGLKILVVDDEFDARTLLVAILEQCNARITAASSTAEAIEILEWLQPDVIISDIGMPIDDGYSFISKVRQWENQRQSLRIPAIALTAHARMEDRVRALSAGFQAHVSKPVDQVELVTVIASLVTRKMAGH